MGDVITYSMYSFLVCISGVYRAAYVSLGSHLVYLNMPPHSSHVTTCDQVSL